MSPYRFGPFNPTAHPIEPDTAAPFAPRGGMSWHLAPFYELRLVSFADLFGNAWWPSNAAGTYLLARQHPSGLAPQLPGDLAWRPRFVTVAKDGIPIELVDDPGQVRSWTLEWGRPYPGPGGPSGSLFQYASADGDPSWSITNAFTADEQVWFGPAHEARQGQASRRPFTGFRGLSGGLFLPLYAAVLDVWSGHFNYDGRPEADWLPYCSSVTPYWP